MPDPFGATIELYKRNVRVVGYIRRLESIMSDLSLGPIAVPKAVTSKCELGWTISLGLHKERGKWVIAEVGNVYPL